MFVDLANLNKGDFFDYCVIGTGPAGITCALALSSAPKKKVLLLEGGDRQYSNKSQEIYNGSVIGDPYFDLSAARLRYFGGTSNHWGGWCRPLDKVDFESKTAFPEANWPIRKTDLDPYLSKAARILETGLPKDDIKLPGGVLKKVDFVFSPVRFSRKYADELQNNQNIAVALNANLVGFSTSGESITTAEVANFDGSRTMVRARRYILATGGIENSRILLWANANTNGQIVKSSRVLGKYWMEHPSFTVGEAVLWNNALLPSGTNRVFFSPTESTIQNSGILNCGLRLEAASYEGTQKMIADIGCVAPDLARELLGLFGRNLVCGARVRAAWEQEPRSVNRIELSTELDTFGIPRSNLYWKKSRADLRTVRTAAELFGKHLADTNTGRLRLHGWVLAQEPYPEDDELAGFHHMGGTRMAETAVDGVVDRNCKVFGQNNLYVAGSSVFPSSGHANPTLTIVQLALRLVDHLQNIA